MKKCVCSYVVTRRPDKKSGGFVDCNIFMNYECLSMGERLRILWRLALKGWKFSNVTFKSI